MHHSFAVTTALALALAYTAHSQDCESFGIDFQNGGTYFQNNQSTDPFMALQEFDGCQNDTANNILVDPSGDQSQCSDTPLLPNLTPQLINCSDWPKDKLYSGDWSLLVISNNGDGDPIAYERDFSLSVGPQQTTTVIPTVTVTNQPVVNRTTETTQIYTSTVPSSTTTDSGLTTVRTITQTLPASVVVVTRGIITQTIRSQTVQVIPTAITVPVACSASATYVKDPVASIVPTILGNLDNVVASIINLNDGLIGNAAGNILGRDEPASAAFKRAIIEGRQPPEELKQAYVLERSKRISNIQKRAPDAATITITATTGVQTSTVDASSTITQTVTSTIISTRTITSGLATVGSGGSISTVTIPASTRTSTVRVPIAISTSTQTIRSTVTNTITTTSAGAVQACASQVEVLA